MTDRTVMAVFCDDIRQELGSKISLMGCFQDILYVQSIPAILPKLCAWVIVSTPYDRPFKSLSIRLVLDGDKDITKLDMRHDELAKMTSNNNENKAPLLVRASITMAPFQIATEGLLQIYIDTEDETLTGPSLELRQAPDQILH